METYSHRARSQIENAAEVVGQSNTLERGEEKAENEIDLPSGQKEERIAYLKFCCWFLWRKRGGRGRSEEEEAKRKESGKRKL